MVNQYKMEAYGVDDALSSQGTPVPLSIAEGLNDKFLICTKHDSIYVSKKELMEVLRLVDKEWLAEAVRECLHDHDGK